MVGRTHFIRHSERDWLFLVNLWEAARILSRERPDVILSTGAGPVVPFALVARVSAADADHLHRDRRPNHRALDDGTHHVSAGAPVLLPVALAGAAFPARNLRRPGVLSTFVSVGNLKKPFVRLLQAVSDNVGLLPGPVMVQHGHYAVRRSELRSRAVPEDGGVPAKGGGCHSSSSCMAGRGRSSRRCRRVSGRRHGAPRGLGEHVDDHQLELVRELSAAGRILVAEDAGSLRAAGARARHFRGLRAAGRQPM